MNVFEFERMEDARVLSESIVNTVRESLVILNEDLRVATANRAFYRKFKTGRPETEGKYIYDLGNNQWDIPALRELLENIIPENEEIENFEVEHDFPDIGHRIMHLNARRMKQQGTRETLILLAIEDVTERAEAQRALEESEARYHRLVEEINSIIIEIDNGGVITFINQFSETLFGYTRDELVGKPLVGTLLPEVDREGTDHSELIAGLLQDPGRYYLNESAGHRKDGQEIWFSWSARKITNPENGETSILIDGNDITDQREARKQARDAYRIINSSNNAIIRLDNQKGIKFVNRAFAEITGKTGEELEGLNLDQVNLPENTRIQFKEVLNAAIQKEGENIGEMVYGDRCLLVRVEPEQEKHGRKAGYMVFASDITERKKIEAQLHNARKIEAIGRLAGGVAHEFNNLLNVIHGNAELMRSRLEEDSPLQRYVREITDTARRAANLSDQLLAYSREQTQTPGKIDLNQEIVMRLNILETLSDRVIDLHFHPEDSVLPVQIDPDQLEQILVLLMDNARDAISQTGSVTITTGNIRLDQPSIEADLPAGDYVRLSFSDTGEGMSRELQEKIFDPFFTTKDVGQGTGLGLSTVLGFVKQCEGGITVESEPGKGSTFHIVFPRAD